jgi:hypothetical protein
MEKKKKNKQGVLHMSVIQAAEQIAFDPTEENIYDALTELMRTNWNVPNVVIMHPLDAIRFEMERAKLKFGKNSISYFLAKRKLRKYAVRQRRFRKVS